MALPRFYGNGFIILVFRANVKSGNPTFKTAQVLRESMDTLDEVERLFTEGVRDAGERAAESVTRMDEGNVQVTVKYKIADENNDSSIKKQIKEHASQLEAMIAVERVTYTPINKKQLHEKVSEKFKTIGYKVERQNFGTIEIGEKQIDKSINYINSDGEKAALFAIPAVLKRGVVVDGHENHKDRGYETITIAAPIEVNGTRGIVGAVVTKIDERNKYRVHRILTPDGSEFTFEVKTKDTEPTSGEPSSSDKRAPIGSASEKSITQPEKSVNRKYSISEENSSDKLCSLDDSWEVSESEAADNQAALERFGTTTDFEQAGFAMADGRMLKLSQYGQRGVQHRVIEGIYEDTKGDEAIGQTKTPEAMLREFGISCLFTEWAQSPEHRAYTGGR